MDFGWTAEQEDLYQRVLTFARAELNHDVRERERAHRFGAAEWRRCGEFGLLGLSAPERYRGLGLGALTTARAIEALGEGCEDMGFVFSIAAHLFACVMPVALYGSEALCERALGRLCTGEWIGANAITEPEAGSDVYALRATAVRDGESYVLNGTKTYVTNGPVADCIVVYASTQPVHGYLGVSAFVVEKGTPGARPRAAVREDGAHHLAHLVAVPARLPGAGEPPARAGGSGRGHLHGLHEVGAVVPVRWVPRRHGAAARPRRRVCAGSGGSSARPSASTRRSRTASPT